MAFLGRIVKHGNRMYNILEHKVQGTPSMINFHANVKMYFTFGILQTRDNNVRPKQGRQSEEEHILMILSHACMKLCLCKRFS